MITHKDRAFCIRSNYCTATECDRHINKEEQEQATLPIAWCDFWDSDCGYVPANQEEYDEQGWN